MIDFVVARALKKDPTVRYQDAYELAADLETCLAELRGQAAATEPSGDKSRTVKMEAGRERANDAPPARAIAIDTRLPISRLLDSTAAVKRIKNASADELTRLPRRVGVLRRVVRDAAVRRLFVVALVAGLAGLYIALL
jgi:hypothetical protein